MSAAELRWREVLKIVTKQYLENLTSRQVNGTNYLKGSPGTVVREIDWIFQQV